MQQDNTLPSLETTQTALDQIEELRGKIHLKGMIIKKKTQNKFISVVLIKKKVIRQGQLKKKFIFLKTL